MSRPIFRKIAYGISFGLAAVMLFTGLVFAKELPDASKMGSVTLTLRDSESDEAIIDGTLELFQIATGLVEDADWSFVLTEDFKDSDILLGDLQDIALAAQFDEYVTNQEIEGISISPDEEGKICFNSLEIGVYLIHQKEKAADYDAIVPFLVTIPLEEGESLVYDVDAAPKCGMPVKQTPSPSPAPTPTPTPGPVPTPTPTPVPTLTPPPVLPQTGQLNWPIPVMIVCGLLFFSLGWYLLRTDEGKQHE